MSYIDMEKINELTKSIIKAKEVGNFENKEIPKKNGFFKNLFSGFGLNSYAKEVQKNSSIRNKDKYNQEALVKYLSNGGNPNANHPTFKTPLIMNVNSPKELATIIAYGGDINAKDKNGRTILEKLLLSLMEKDTLKENNKLINRYAEMVILLLKNGANLENESGSNVLRTASNIKNNEILSTISQTIAETNPSFCRKFAEREGISINTLNSNLNINVPKDSIVEVEVNDTDRDKTVVDIYINVNKNKEKEKINEVDEEIDIDTAARIYNLKQDNKDKDFMSFKEFRSKLSKDNTGNEAADKYEKYITKKIEAPSKTDSKERVAGIESALSEQMGISR